VIKASLAGLVCIAVFGCAQTVSHAPSPITATKANLQIIVRDLRAERTGSVELISAIQSQISNALPKSKALHSRYTLTVDVIEHRSFFTMGNWNASTRLKCRVQQGSGSIIRENLGRLSKKGAGLPDDVAMVRQSCEVCVGFPSKLRADLDRDKDYWKPDVDL
jgi:hypothetical protein